MNNLAATLIATRSRVNKPYFVLMGNFGKQSHCLAPTAHGIFPVLLAGKPTNIPNNNGEKL